MEVSVGKIDIDDGILIVLPFDDGAHKVPR